MLPTLPSLRRRTVLWASGTAVVLAVAGGTTAAFASGADDPSPSPSPSASCTVRLGGVLRVGGPELRQDLRDLRRDAKGDRAADRKAIREKALAGGYGPRVRRVATIVAGGGAQRGASALPTALRNDLRHLRTTTKPKTDERRAAAQLIVQKALDGAYGDAYQQRAQHLQQARSERCAAK